MNFVLSLYRRNFDIIIKNVSENYEKEYLKLMNE
jgi:hypothetical protein